MRYFFHSFQTIPEGGVTRRPSGAVIGGEMGEVSQPLIDAFIEFIEPQKDCCYFGSRHIEGDAECGESVSPGGGTRSMAVINS